MYSLILYIVGVLVFQQGAVLCQCYTSVVGKPGTSVFAMLWCLMLYPAELLKPGAYSQVLPSANLGRYKTAEWVHPFHTRFIPPC